jgi:hypothetical protein
MKKLVDPNRDGGYPLTGEALEILGKDMPEYINAILDDIIPENSIVFLTGDYAYVKRPSNGIGQSTVSEIMKVTLNGITREQLLTGNNFSYSVVSQTNSDTIGITSYDNTRREISITISNGFPAGHPQVFTLDSLLKARYVEKEVDYINSITIETTLPNSSVSGHAIMKGGYADLDLILSYTGDGESIKLTLPEVFKTNAIFTYAPNIAPESSDYGVVQTRLIGKEIILIPPITSGVAYIHFHYKPIINNNNHYPEIETEPTLG